MHVGGNSKIHYEFFLLILSNETYGFFLAIKIYEFNSKTSLLKVKKQLSNFSFQNKIKKNSQILLKIKILH